MNKYLLTLYIIVLLVFLTACRNEIAFEEGLVSYSDRGVNITNKGNYFEVVLDYTTELTPYQMGEAYAKGILQVVPNFEKLVDSYIAQSITKYDYNTFLFEVEDIRPQVHEDYRHEIEGMSSQFSAGNNNIRDDGKISNDEFFLFNLFADVYRGTQCSFVSVFGEFSETKRNITARNLDWFGGDSNQIPQIQAVITIKYPDRKVCFIGYMGFMGVLTAFNDDKIYAAILDSPSGLPYTSTGRRSYPFDLRYALENNSTIEGVANYMLDAEKHYTFNHLICLADADKSVVLENNFSGIGPDNNRVKRAIRYSDSQLNERITWGIENAVGAVNSFVLFGNYNNHTVNRYNVDRWETMKTQLLSKGESVTVEELKEIITYKKGALQPLTQAKYLYNRLTIQSIIFEPDTLALQVYFRPKNEIANPDTPIYENIEVFK